jgi:penicillin-binding protein 3
MELIEAKNVEYVQILDQDFLTVEGITSNSLSVGFAPSNNPTISFVCVAPTSSTGRLQSNICAEMSAKALVEYYKTYE